MSNFSNCSKALAKLFGKAIKLSRNHFQLPATAKSTTTFVEASPSARETLINSN